MRTGVKKYELVSETTTAPNGATLRRIRALRDIEVFGVKKGDFGGFVESESNLSHDDNAWVGGNAKVYGPARVICDALVDGTSKVCGISFIRDNAVVTGKAYCENVFVENAALVSENACLLNSRVVDSAVVKGNASIRYARVYEQATVSGDLQSYFNLLSFGSNARIDNISQFMTLRMPEDNHSAYCIYRDSDGAFWFELLDVFGCERFTFDQMTERDRALCDFAVERLSKTYDAD